MISFNKEKCINCLKCVAVCPFTVLGVVDGAPVYRAEKLCISCLHCAATCPAEAVLYDGTDTVLEKSLPVLPTGFAGNLEDYLISVRSCRHFKSTPVDKKLLERALKLAQWAPSAKNQHPTDWIVLTDESKFEQIMTHIMDYMKENNNWPEVASEYALGNNMVLGNGTKTILLGHASESMINPPVDTALALQNVTLVLNAHGVSTCWAGYLTRFINLIPELRELIELPEGHNIYGSLMTGYPNDEEYLHIPRKVKSPDIRWI
jgi:nitroreductase/NAD-dependent dihydropyrimidine dehydrogenase PreA subunit